MARKGSAEATRRAVTCGVVMRGEVMRGEVMRGAAGSSIILTWTLSAFRVAKSTE